jgi:D-arabinose 1-dehydrogenase-like Zn-dependent alcohol dehydrogenase
LHQIRKDIPITLQINFHYRNIKHHHAKNESGKFKPVIDRIYTLDQIAEAYTYVETGQKTGIVVLRIE